MKYVIWGLGLAVISGTPVMRPTPRLVAQLEDALVVTVTVTREKRECGIVDGGRDRSAA